MNGCYDFTPDWTEIMTKAQMEREFSGRGRPGLTPAGFPSEFDFIFNGEGWYLTPTDTMLVAHISPLKVPANIGANDEARKYRVFVWNRAYPPGSSDPESPINIFRCIARLVSDNGIRYDTRE